jgi:hypothetical protein
MNRANIKGTIAKGHAHAVTFDKRNGDRKMSALTRLMMKPARL